MTATAGTRVMPESLDTTLVQAPGGLARLTADSRRRDRAAVSVEARVSDGADFGAEGRR